jgi:hypothetical protein
MSDDIIDFEAAQNRRVDAEIDRDAARWDAALSQLAATMAAAGQSDAGLVSAVLRALLDTLEAEGVNRGDAKESIARALNVFRNHKWAVAVENRAVTSSGVFLRTFKLEDLARLNR